MNKKKIAKIIDKIIAIRKELESEEQQLDDLIDTRPASSAKHVGHSGILLRAIDDLKTAENELSNI